MKIKQRILGVKLRASVKGHAALPVARRLRPEPWRPSAPSPPRASLKLNMKIFNPPNQDGVNCQFAAILDQLQLLRCLPSELNTVGLKRLAFTWLAVSRSTATTLSARSGTAVEGWNPSFMDYWEDEY